MKELDIPFDVAAEETSEAVEMVRFWIAKGGDHVALNIGMFDAAKEPGCWGMIAADIIKHAVRGMRRNDPGRDEKTMLAQVEKAFVERLAYNANLTGQIGGRSQ